MWRLSKEQGLGLGFWANWDPIWAKWDPSRQFVRKVCKSALGKKIQSHSHACCTFTLLSCLSIHYTAAFHRFTQLIKPHLAQCCFAGWKCCSTGTQNKCFGKDITRYWQVAHDIERLLLGMGARFSRPGPGPGTDNKFLLCSSNLSVMFESLWCDSDMAWLLNLNSRLISLSPATARPSLCDSKPFSSGI